MIKKKKRKDSSREGLSLFTTDFSQLLQPKNYSPSNFLIKSVAADVVSAAV